MGVSLNVNRQKGQGKWSSQETHYTNSHLSAGNKLKTSSGTSTLIIGGVLTGKEIETDVGIEGHGDLIIKSMQDTKYAYHDDTYRNIGGSLCIPGACAGTSSERMSQVFMVARSPSIMISRRNNSNQNTMVAFGFLRSSDAFVFLYV